MGSKFLDATGLAYLWGKIKSYVGTTIDAKAAGCENILDNWYWVGGGSQQGGGQFPINQRGETTYSGTKDTIDRWYQEGSAASTTVSSDCVTLTASTSANSFWSQYLDKNLEPGEYTISAYIKGSGSGYVAVYSGSTTYGSGKTYSNPGNDWVLYTNTVNITTVSSPRVRIRVDSNKAISIAALKMEKGEVSTLANDPIPNFAEQFVRCVANMNRSADTYANKTVATVDNTSANGLVNALSTGTSGSANTADAYLITQYSTGAQDTYFRRKASDVRVGGLTTARSLKVALGSTTAVTFDGTAAQDSIPVSGTLGIDHGGTGVTSLTASRLVMTNSNADGLTTRAITNNTSKTTISASTNIPTMNTIYYGLNAALNRTTNVNAADTNYTTVMARGITLRDTGTYTNTNGVISLVYE